MNSSLGLGGTVLDDVIEHDHEYHSDQEENI